MKEPAVIRLPFHLPNKQAIVFRDHEQIPTVLDKTNAKKTMLLAWFEANMLYPEVRNLTCNEFPTKFVSKEECASWLPRKQGFAISRISHVPARNGEDYYLQLLY